MRVLKKSQERTEEDRRELSRLVQDIIDNVRANKDEALKEYGRKFDACEREQIRVSKDEIEEAYAQLSDEEIEDLKSAASNIRAFAKAQRETVKPLENFSPMPGIFLGHRIIPVNSCCCYVPGGNYPLYSTALMLIIPAHNNSRN